MKSSSSASEGQAKVDVPAVLRLEAKGGSAHAVHAALEDVNGDGSPGLAFGCGRDRVSETAGWTFRAVLPTMSEIKL